jgi:hypothetical protein
MADTWFFEVYDENGKRIANGYRYTRDVAMRDAAAMLDVLGGKRLVVWRSEPPQAAA